MLDARESLRFAEQAVLLRYPTLAGALVDAETLLKAPRIEDEDADLWNTMNRLQLCLDPHKLMDSTGYRNSRMTGFPWQMSGLMVMRDRREVINEGHCSQKLAAMLARNCSGVSEK